MADDGGVTETLHGIKITDEYRWLEDAGSARTKEFVDGQDKRAMNLLSGLPLRDRIRDRILELTDIDFFGVFRPYKLGDGRARYRYFQTRKRPGQKFAAIYYRDGLEGKERLALDPNTFSEDGTLSLQSMYISRDGGKIAYSVSKGGSDRGDTYVLDLNSGKKMPDVISDVRYLEAAWLPDGSGFYYTRGNDPNSEVDRKYAYRVYFHRLGTDSGSDTPLFEKDIQTFIVDVYVPRHSNYLFIYKSTGWSKTDIYYKDLDSDSGIMPFVVGLDAKSRVLDVVGGSIYMLTDYEAPNGRVVKFKIDNPGVEGWQEVLKESDGVLDEFVVSGDRAIAIYLDNVNERIFVCDADGKNLKEVELPSIGVVSGMAVEPDGTRAFLIHESTIKPATHYMLDIGKPSLEELERSKANIDSDDFELKQVWYKSRDGTEIPMSVATKRGLALDGKNPVLLTGYGGFAVPELPVFSSLYMALIEHGVVCASANIRGGGEFGEKWHRAGMLENKQNTFDDFICAAEFLIANKYTSKDRLAIIGGSNGGLLVAACMVQRPDLFEVVVCSAPLLDMIRFPKFAGGQLWISEYGNPEKEDEFKYLLKYSPYHNLKKGQRYPPILFMSAENDDRVDPMHARKMAAKMLDYNRDGLVLIKTERNLGHGAGATVATYAESAADKAAFVLWRLGVEK